MMRNFRIVEKAANSASKRTILVPSKNGMGHEKWTVFNPPKRMDRGFTLIEMLTVIAISAVLLTIIVAPIFQSFNLTRAAQTFATAQNDARALTEKISRELASAISVRSSSVTVATTLNGNNVNLPGHSLIVQVPGKLNTSNNTRPIVDVVLPWTKVDVVPPGQVGPGSAGSYIDPVTGKIDPTLKAYKGQVQTPLVPSTIMVRYALGLRDPAALYNEPYSGVLMAQAGGRDNLIAAYRFTFAPYVVETVKNVTSKVVNSALFATDSNGNIVLDDPRFLVFDRDPANANPITNIVQDDHNLRVYHWMGQSAPWETGSGVEDNAANFAHGVLQTQVSRFDMIMPQYDLASRLPTYDTATTGAGVSVGIPRITPLLQFKPTVVSNDPAAGQEALRPGEETDNALAIAPDMYKTEYGLWNNAIVRTYPAGYNNSLAANDKYSIGYPSNTPNVPGFSVYAYNPSVSGANEFSTGTEYFDDYTYENSLAALSGNGTVYPFSQACNAANGRSGWLDDLAVHAVFTPYDTIPGTGKIRASFDISEVGNVNATLPNDPDQDPNRPNQPTLYIAETPIDPISDQGTNYPMSPLDASESNPYDINRAFNEVWNQHPYLQPDIRRFIDLRVLTNEDGTFSPLYMNQVANAVTDFQIPQADGSMLNRCRIVPGTEAVVGPDQMPGEHYGHPIRYSRITTGAPGMNQYRINYVDQQEPNEDAGNVTTVNANAYMTALGLTKADIAEFNPTKYDPTNFVSATIQPRYKAGYIWLNSDPTQPLPQGYYTGTGGTGTLVKVPFKVDYRFQFTGVLSSTNVSAGAGSADVFSVDYDTRQLMQVLLTLRSLPQSNMPNPQTVTLKATATLRNVAR